jgi:hypothetical protein
MFGSLEECPWRGQWDPSPFLVVRWVVLLCHGIPPWSAATDTWTETSKTGTKINLFFFISLLVLIFAIEMESWLRQGHTAERQHCLKEPQLTSNTKNIGMKKPKWPSKSTHPSYYFPALTDHVYWKQWLTNQSAKGCVGRMDLYQKVK